MNGLPPRIPPQVAEILDAAVRYPTTRGHVAYEPPTPPLAKPAEVPILGRADSYESAVVRVALPTSAIVGVYATLRRWRGIDVYLSVPPGVVIGAASAVAIGIQVFAVTAGVRALIASGRFSLVDQNRGTPKWMVSARAACERWEVRLSYNDLPATGSEFVDVAVIASDEATDSPDYPIGSKSMNSGTNDRMSSAGSGVAVSALALDPLTLLSVNAVTSSAAGRWVHIHDLGTVAACAGFAPIFAYKLAQLGLGGAGLPLPAAILQNRVFSTGIAIAASSTALATTLVAGDVALNGWYR